MTNPKLRFKLAKGTAFPDWNKKQLAAVLSVKHGRDYKGLPVGTIPVLGTGGKITYVDRALCDWPCALIGRKGTINKPQYMDVPFWSVDTLFYTKPVKNNNPKFQYYLFQTIDWLKYNEASGVPSLSASTIEHIQKYIPVDQEQQKIADFFSALDEKIALAERKLSVLQTLKSGLMQKIFNREIRFKREDGSSFCDWQAKTIADIGAVTTGMTPLTKEKSYYGGEYLFCGPADLNEQKYVSSCAKGLTRIGLDVARKIPTGAILITCIGSTIGKMGIAARELATNQQINSLVVSNDMDNEFVFYAIKHNFYKFIGEIGKQAVPILSKGKLEKQKLLVACKEEQQIIGRFLKGIDDKILLQQRMLRVVRQQKQAFMQQMFV